ncbi:hypothetical protein F2P81_010566 [Scophthalmus maximus]|uniref:Glycosyltransferase 2-like domain-containing protein n=1 Tax=Scophthalmus maximus TaxID=52904 RepID=A0A6A4T659_SCOMX|nr:hypothetical protein F2P81_010566 [Scophthalmus maximus]
MEPPKRLRTAAGDAETPSGERGEAGSAVDVSVVMPVYNASCWLDECLQAISEQDFTGSMELSVYDDASTDDVMLHQRVRLQYEVSVLHPNSVFTSHGPTVVMPTWFCSKNWFLKVGPFDEGGKGVPEDLLFFYQSLRRGGGLSRVDQCLLVYRYHEKAATHSVTEETIWKLRVDYLQERVLSQWESFTIWNAGKQGRKLYRCLSWANQKKVKAFCDVDYNKIQKGFYTYEESKEIPKPKVPILHYRAASAPFIICVKLDMTGGVLEQNLNSLQLKEGTDYYHFN